MNKIIFLVVLIFTFCFYRAELLAVEEEGHNEAMEQATSSDSTPMIQELKNVNNQICPVSDEKVGGMGEIVHIEHEGKIYNLCCSMCAKDFKKDPQKYILKVEEELSAMEKAQEEAPEITQQ